jgi:tetratricopeptide (TPR) repeat protein
VKAENKMLQQKLSLRAKPVILAVTVIMAAVVASGCTTMGRSTADGEVNQSMKTTVVTQVGSKNPVVAGKDRDFWLEMRQMKDLKARTIGSMATGESEAAVGFAKARLAKNPGDPEALTQLAAALALTRNYELASYYATLADRVRPGNAETLNVRGLATMLTQSARMSDFRTAAIFFQQAMDADSSQIAPGLNLGNLYLELGNATAAVSVFEQVVSRCGNCSAGMIGLGVAQRRTGKYDAALATFQSVLKKNPNNSAALFNIALVYNNGLNNRKDAEEALHKLLASTNIKDVDLRKKAHTVLRRLKGEADTEDRTQMVDSPAADEGDAELLMSTSEFED